MASTDAMSEQAGEEMASLPLTDDLLAEIFLRLPAAADLVRASAVCVAFRSLVTARPFVLRFRKLHGTPLLGFLDEDQTFHPAEPPHPSAPGASETALAADFSFSFLPAPARADAWAVQDSRDGRILLDTKEDAVFTETVVCDPLHQRYILLPPVPDNLAASMQDTLPEEPLIWRDVFLVPPSDDEEEDETSFRVIWMGQCKTNLFAFVFSSGTGRWRAIPPARWDDLFPRLTLSTETRFGSRQYVYGCFYWRPDCEMESDMLLLDTARMEFSVAQPPHEAQPSYSVLMAMVEAGGSRPGMFAVAPGGKSISYSIRQSSGEWRHERTIRIGRGHFLIGSTPRYLLLYKLQIGFYTLDLQTFQLQEACEAVLYFFMKLRAYSNFPPSFLSLPTVLRKKLMGCCYMAILQAQAHSHHDQKSFDTNSGGRVLMITDGAEAVTQLDS